MPELLDQLNGLAYRSECNTEPDPVAGSADVVSDVAAIAEDVRKSTPEVVVASAEKATEELQHAAQTLDRDTADQRDAIGALIDEWTVDRRAPCAVPPIRSTADRREPAGAARFHTDTGLYEYTGLAQDAQRLVDQFSRITEQLERDPARFLLGDRSQGVRTE